MSALLQLKRIKCHTTEDNTGRDEVYIKLDGARVWEPWSMNDGDEETLEGAIPPREFEESISVELWDHDQGWGDDDDHLGTVDLTPNMYHHYWLNPVRFTGDGASYDLWVRITFPTPNS